MKKVLIGSVFFGLILPSYIQGCTFSLVPYDEDETADGSDAGKDSKADGSDSSKADSAKFCSSLDVSDASALDACNSCLSLHCCAATSACYDDRDCSDLSQAIVDCDKPPPGTSVDECRADARLAFQTSPNALRLYDAFIQCGDSYCGRVCQ